MEFKYRAKDNNGSMREGIVIAEDQEHAENLIRDNDLTILSLDIIEESLFEKIWPFGKGVPTKEMVLFSRQLATLIGAKVTILQSLRILLEQVTNARLKQVIGELINSIESGNSLSLSLARYPKLFGNVFVSVVRTGEVSGALESSLTYLADQMEKDYELSSKVVRAMAYPGFILGALIVIGSLMFLFVLPNLTSILLQQGGGQLPFITRMLISFTNFFKSWWWAVFISAGVLILGFRYYINTYTGRYQWDRIKISVPIFGPIFKQIYLARFSRNLATLVASGIPIIKALTVVSGLVNNVIYRDIILEAAQRLAGGKGIADSLSGHPEIPPIVTQMIQVGEQSATLNNILAKLAKYYEGEVDAKISVLTTLMEPIIMVILGIAVGILVAGILLPIYNLASSAS